ncbi:MAG: hypothetical protein U0326_22680 [Polyangiales bacterium]
MQRKTTAIPFVLALSLVGVVAHSNRAGAQIDPYRQSYGVYERDLLVGEIFRDETDPAHYSEHWVLYPEYVYPGASNGLSVVIRPSGMSYENLSDFFRRVRWDRGSRYVETVCNDGASLPVRR